MKNLLWERSLRPECGKPKLLSFSAQNKSRTSRTLLYAPETRFCELILLARSMFPSFAWDINHMPSKYACLSDLVSSGGENKHRMVHCCFLRSPNLRRVAKNNKRLFSCTLGKISIKLVWVLSQLVYGVFFQWCYQTQKEIVYVEMLREAGLLSRQGHLELGS